MVTVTVRGNDPRFVGVHFSSGVESRHARREPEDDPEGIGLRYRVWGLPGLGSRV